MRSLKTVVLIAHFLLVAVIHAGAGMAADEGPGDNLPSRYSKGQNAFHSYLPTYIGVTPSHSTSSNEGELKLQFSVKYELVEDWDWYFAYTQKSFWSIQHDSAPFRESNYSPETFWLYKPDDLSWLPVVQMGFYRHESTGEAGAGSHGWDITYVEPVFRWKDIYIIPRVWAPSFLQGFSEKRAAPDNPDIFRYAGYGKLSVILGSNSNLQFAFGVQHAPKDNSAAWEGQMDLSWDVMVDVYNKLLKAHHSPKLHPFFFVQARNGYGEGLKTYNEKTNSIVVGISLVR